MFLIYFGIIYSDGWNMAAYDKKPYLNAKLNPLRPALAYLPQLVIPLIIVIIYFIPINTWRPFSDSADLKADTQYTIILHGTADTYADDIRIVKVPEDTKKIEEYMTVKDVNTNGGFENDGEWVFDGGAKKAEGIAHDGAYALKFDSDGTASYTFTVPEDGEYYVGGFCKPTGNLKVEIPNVLEHNATEFITPLNRLIFLIAATVWYMPLSIFYNISGNPIGPLNIAYLIFIPPVIAIIGYLVGTTGFSILDKYATYKNKRLKEKKKAAEEEKKAIREQMRRNKK